MKRVDLIRAIEGLGCELVRHGGKHDWYRNPTTGVAQPVPRHREIRDGLARHIVRMLSNPPPPSGGEASDEPAPPAGSQEGDEPA
jgi:predicted RNA binding protein YcfA (HicA-like mRNA interferase family)